MYYDIILVVAPNFAVFCEEAVWKAIKSGLTDVKFDRGKGMLQIGDVQYKYIHSVENMRGYRCVEVEFWGNKLDVPNIEEFEREAEIVRYA